MLDHQTATPQPPESPRLPTLEAMPEQATPRRTSSPHRKATLDSLRVEKEVAAFKGLPSGVTHPIQLLDTIKRAAPEMNIPRPVIALLDQLFKHTNPKDWTPSSRPIVWPRNDTLAMAAGLSNKAISTAIQGASTRGIVVMKDSPTRARAGKRSKDGAVVPEESYGFDLSPLATRYPEFAAAAARREEFMRAVSQARRQITITRHKLAQIMETADEQRLWGADWEAVHQRVKALQIPRRFAGLELPALQHFAVTLTAIERDARALLECAMSTATPPEGGKQEHPDNSTPSIPKNRSALPKNGGPMNQVIPHEENLEPRGGLPPVPDPACSALPVCAEQISSLTLSPADASSCVAEAGRMLDAFTSVGAAAFDITTTTLQQQKSSFRSAEPAPQLQADLPRLIAHAEKNQHNLIIRPRLSPPRSFSEPSITLVQLDDIEPINLEEIAHAAFLTVQTSTTGFQAWVAVADAPKGFAARLKAGLLADQNASGAVRLAGTHNFKPAYAPEFPLVRVLDVTPGRVVTAASLMHLLAPEKAPPVASPPSPFRSGRPRRPTSKWPSYQRCLDNAPIGPTGNPMRSRADFVWCKIALSWGHSIEATAEKLLEESSKAKENGRDYAYKTASHAEHAAQQRNAQISDTPRGRA